jgi:hypothetical protein
MKVLNLRCAHDHRFEGWFGSEDDFQSQLARSLIECPLCSDHTITRLPSAPRLNVSGARETRPARSAERDVNHVAAKGSEGGPNSGAHDGANANSHANANQAAGSAGAMVPANSNGSPIPIEQMQAQWMQAVKHAIANTEDVGQHFAEEARRIHYGEAQERAIRGSASMEQAHELREEGIDVMALPMPAALKGTIQ